MPFRTQQNLHKMRTYVFDSVLFFTKIVNQFFCRLKFPNHFVVAKIFKALFFATKIFKTSFLSLKFLKPFNPFPRRSFPSRIQNKKRNKRIQISISFLDSYLHAASLCKNSPQKGEKTNSNRFVTPLRSSTKHNQDRKKVNFLFSVKKHSFIIPF